MRVSRYRVHIWQEGWRVRSRFEGTRSACLDASYRVVGYAGVRSSLLSLRRESIVNVCEVRQVLLLGCVGVALAGVSSCSENSVKGGSAGSAAGNGSSAPPEFLSQPYTMRDLVLDELEEDAEAWANRVDGIQDWSSGVDEGEFGISVLSSITPPSLDSLNRVVVEVAFTVDGINEDPADVCKDLVQMAADEILGMDVRDRYGTHMRRKRMRARFGNATASDTGGVRAAALWMYTQTMVRLSLLEMNSERQFVCTTKAKPGEASYIGSSGL